MLTYDHTHIYIRCDTGYIIVMFRYVQRALIFAETCTLRNTCRWKPRSQDGYVSHVLCII